MAAGYAAGMSSYDLERESLMATQKHNLIRLVDPNLESGGIDRGERLLAFFKHEFGESTFSELQLPLALVAVDLNSHKEIVLNEGSVALALRATTSLPGIFIPLEMNGWRLVDGGSLNDLPVDVVSKMRAEVIIAVDIALSSKAGFGHQLAKNRCQCYMDRIKFNHGLKIWIADS